MKIEEPNIIFSQKCASDFDAHREKLASIKDALHLSIRMLTSKLPSDSQVLIIGAGTGSELIALAQAFPQWGFTVVEPASAMLEVCKLRAEKQGITSRCLFHEGYLDSLPDSRSFDVATSILVSHFIMNPKKRSQYFSEIASRLRCGAYLIEACLASDMSKPAYNQLLEVWINMHDYAKIPVHVDSFGNKVSILPVEKVETIIESGGFDTPVLFFQTLLIHAWFTQVSPK